MIYMKIYITIESEDGKFVEFLQQDFNDPIVYQTFRELTKAVETNIKMYSSMDRLKAITKRLSKR